MILASSKRDLRKRLNLESTGQADQFHRWRAGGLYDTWNKCVGVGEEAVCDDVNCQALHERRRHTQQRELCWALRMERKWWLSVHGTTGGGNTGVSTRHLSSQSFRRDGERGNSAWAAPRSRCNAVRPDKCPSQRDAN